VGTDPDWRTLLTAYKSAVEDFDRVTAALTAAIADRSSDPSDFPALFAAEASARDAVILARIRLMNAWRDSSPELELLEALLPNAFDKRV
jgi:hypothetical protein